MAYAGDTSNLQGAWLLDETSGTRYDETDNDNDLTDNNTVLYDTGQFGNAADFEYSNQEYLSITDANQTGLDITGTYTFATFFNIETSQGSNYLMSKRAHPSAYNLNLAGSEFQLTHDAGIDAYYTQTFNTGTWYHICVVYDTSNDDVEWIINGSSEETDSSITDDPSDNAGAFCLGADSSGADWYDGLLDEAIIFTRTLSESECDALYQNGIEAFISPPVARRIFIIANAFFSPYAILAQVNYISMVNTHKKKFNIPRPNWMKLWDVPEAYAQLIDAVADKVKALLELEKRKTQDDVKEDSKYIQRMPKETDGITYQTHVYEGPKGVGYVQVAEKEEDKKVYWLRRNFGPETRNYSEDWEEVKRRE